MTTTHLIFKSIIEGRSRIPFLLIKEARFSENNCTIIKINNSLMKKHTLQVTTSHLIF